MGEERKSKLKLYLKVAWILKIRLLSARRQLWDAQTSLIHMENACLQVRKSCEAIAYLCLIAAEIDNKTISKNLKNNYQTRKLFKELDKRGVLRFPNPARLTTQAVREQNSVLELKIASYENSEIERVGKIHSQLGQLLHDNSLLNGVELLSLSELNNLLNTLRGDHQWLWNRFWHHSFRFQGKLFFVNLGDMTKASNPTFIKEEGFLDEDIELDFNPELIADFSGEIDWSRFT